jgi:hypothetical protein
MPEFKNKDGNLTRYALSCGYVEKNKDLTLGMEHGFYYVRGFRGQKHIMESFDSIKKARKELMK